MKRCLTLLVLLLGACPQPVGVDGPQDLAAPVEPGADLQSSPEDLTSAGECMTPMDCMKLDTPPSVRFCPSSAWSCIAGRCTWECKGNRTCELRPGGCLSCDGGEPVCRTASCGGSITTKMPMIDEALCARGFLQEIKSCFDGYVQLEGGMLCTLEDLATGLQRELLACGRCQTAVVYSN